MTSRLYKFTYLIGLTVVLSCGSSENHQKDHPDETTRSDTVSMTNDPTPPPPKPGPAPGQARIRGEITNIQEPEERQNFITITFKIIGVDAYGPSTPPLAAHDSVKVRARKSTIEKKGISSGKIVTAVISYRQAILGYSETPRWSLVALD